MGATHVPEGGQVASVVPAAALALTLAANLAVPWLEEARGGGRSSRSSHSSGSHSSIKCLSCPQDSQGKIECNRSAMEEFKRAHPKPPATTTAR